MYVDIFFCLILLMFMQFCFPIPFFVDNALLVWFPWATCLFIEIFVTKI
ncbi:hypothetical protein M233_07485 [Xylella fastidiosa subsp. multiplex Griffin-1]|nr:hypothetical protein M233_07485 [Xylella fastidiosa subsp. multiplex Griffin-1]